MTFSWVLFISALKYFLKLDLGFVEAVGCIYQIVCCLTLDLLKLQVVFVNLSAAWYRISKSSRSYFWKCPDVTCYRKIWKIKVYFDISVLTMVGVLWLKGHSKFQTIGSTDIKMKVVHLKWLDSVYQRSFFCCLNSNKKKKSIWSP